MSEASSAFSDNPSSVAIDLLPKTALQALYHAVTGKTETYSKTLSKNVVITYHSFEQLYHRIKQQIAHYTLLADPTVTVIVKHADSKTVQYSSIWERFPSERAILF